MKRSILFVLFMSAIRFSISAYDYQTVYSHRVALYGNPNNEIKCLRIDSTRFNGDSILYPFKNIQEQGFNCYTPYGASWLGGKIIVNPHWNYFFNQNSDTISIKTDAKKSESWILYKRSDLSIEATVQSHDTMTVFGVKDSVKTIGLTAYGATVNNSFTTGQLVLSKHFGLIKTYNFIVFPDYTNNSQVNPGLELNTLAGLTNPTVGLQNLTWFDVNDFQAGDEIHTSHKSWDFYVYMPTAYTEEKTILKYLSRQDYADSIVYQLDRTSWSNHGVIPVTHEITRSVIYKDADFDKLPTEPVVSFNYAFAYTMKIDSFTIKTRPSVYSEIWKYDTSDCWRPPVADGCFPEFLYYKGLGGPYYNCIDLMGSGEENKLLYYKKGPVSWGSPLVISGTDEPEINSEILLYPNPAHDKISVSAVSLSEPCTFELMDVSGNLLIRRELSTSSNSVSLSGYTGGLYLYRLLNKGKMIKAGKIVKM